MERLEDLYASRLKKTGVALTGKQLWALRDRRAKGVTKARIYRFLREGSGPEQGSFAQPASRRPPAYATVGVSKPGCYFIDYGEFHRGWSRLNGGSTGFLVAVENVTNRLFAYPTRGKDTRQWLDSIARFIELNRDVKIVYSDRDAVATSPSFRQTVQDKYGLRWYFLRKGHKSWLAERFVRHLKTKLSQGLASRGAGSKRWTDLLPAICRAYNDERVEGTTYRRGAVNETNFDRFVGQLFGVKGGDPSLERYNRSVAGPFEQAAWNKRVFRFGLGDKVLLLRTANWRDRSSASQGTSTFGKPSLEGAFGTRPYTVSRRQLRADRTFGTYVPVYGLAELEDRLHFYENELVPQRDPAAAAGGQRREAADRPREDEAR